MVPVMVLAYPIDLFLSKYVKKSNQFYGELEVWNDLYDGKINAEMLIYGSSRAWVHFNPAILADSLQVSVYNLGLDGHHFWLQYLRHLEFLKHNPAPKQILLSLDYTSLQKRDELYLYQQFLPYMLWNNNIKYYTQSYKGFKYLDYSLPLLRYAGETSLLKKSLEIALDKDTVLPFRKNGYRGIQKAWTNEFELAKEKMDSYRIKIDPESVRLFDAFLHDCKNKGIEVTLVYSPEYIDGQKFVVNREEVMELYNNFANKYKLAFLDYSNDTISYRKSYFYNTTHLNKTGSNLFTRTLAHDLKQTQSHRKSL